MRSKINFDRSTSEFCGRNRFRSRRYIYMWVIRVRNRFNLAKSQMSHLLAQPFERGGGVNNLKIWRFVKRDIYI